eukprot:TRINITY_DN58049_c0_g1_i16.p1 TRINITY_DN58049_c0_g1~~TRINITY_DN58049_c0_g1_i16.p1  ORF type:complete len:248 (+),score=3.32 TRINITY_DN58049_c0_g1_i16:38-781(+)
MFSFSIFFFFFFHRQSRVFTRAFDSRFQGVCIGHTLFLFYFCFFFFFFFCWCTHRFFFFNDTATTEIYTNLNTLSLHDALPIQVLLLQSGRCFFFKVHTSQKTVAFLASRKIILIIIIKMLSVLKDLGLLQGRLRNPVYLDRKIPKTRRSKEYDCNNKNVEEFYVDFINEAKRKDLRCSWHSTVLHITAHKSLHCEGINSWDRIEVSFSPTSLPPLTSTPKGSSSKPVNNVVQISLRQKLIVQRLQF